MDSLGKLMVIAGLALAVCGVVVWLIGGKGQGWILPGDISFERGPFAFYFPIVTCIVLSLLLTLLFRLFNR